MLTLNHNEWWQAGASLRQLSWWSWWWRGWRWWWWWSWWWGKLTQPSPRWSGRQREWASRRSSCRSGSPSCTQTTIHSYVVMSKCQKVQCVLVLISILHSPLSWRPSSCWSGWQRCERIITKTFLAQIRGSATGGPPSMGNTKNSPLEVTIYIQNMGIMMIIWLALIVMLIVNDNLWWRWKRCWW